MDNWLDVPFLREGTIARCKSADLIGVPTPQIKDRIDAELPGLNVAVFEEPIDTDRLSASAQLEKIPTVLWCGNPANLVHLTGLLNVLKEVNQQIPFKLRVVSGIRPVSSLMRGLDFEWRKFNHENEGALLGGSWVGLSPLSDTSYNVCKGAYKIKTYMSAGIAVIASPVGYQKQLVSDGVNGCLARTDEDWRTFLFELLRSPERAVELGKNARQHALDTFSYHAVMKQWRINLHAFAHTQ
jgi:glycosyltransferase involved in cell wall biosynthesis